VAFALFGAIESDGKGVLRATDRQAACKPCLAVLVVRVSSVSRQIIATRRDLPALGAVPGPGPAGAGNGDAGKLSVLRLGRLTLACLVVLTCQVIAFAGSAAEAPEGNVKSQHGDWQVVCKDPPPGAKTGVCALVQSVTAEDKNNIGLTVYFQRFSNGTRVLRVFAPLGVLLPPGLGLKIDDKDVGHAPFLRCHNFACYAQVVVEDPLIEQLKTGQTAIFIIFQTEEAGIGIPISLAGFGEALAALN
jgi:invasion protein IalB